ncbi:hypothetical protein V2J09_002311, partial [Rumex salicifolius]
SWSRIRRDVGGGLLRRSPRLQLADGREGAGLGEGLHGGAQYSSGVRWQPRFAGDIAWLLALLKHKGSNRAKNCLIDYQNKGGRRMMSCDGDSTSAETPSTPNHIRERHSQSPQRPPKVARSLGEDPRHLYGEGGKVKEASGVTELGDIAQNQLMNPRTGMQRYLVAIEYSGTRFFGSQQQPTHRTVVGVLEEAFKKFIGQPVSILCSSRTVSASMTSGFRALKVSNDAGVHGLSNVCHVDIERISKRKPGEALPPHEPSVVKRAVNHFLQKDNPDVMVTDVRCVSSDFHARYKALERTYCYRLLCGPDPVSIFEKDRAWHVVEEMNLEAMQEACKVLVGCHDFSSFRAAGCQAKSPVRSLDEFSVFESLSTPYIPSFLGRGNWNFDGEKISTTFDGHKAGYEAATSNGSSPLFGIRKLHRCLVVTARARSFLYHQVRLLVGVLKCVGTGELTVADVQRVLDAKNVIAAKPMAPACGLYLAQVKYDLP